MYQEVITRMNIKATELKQLIKSFLIKKGLKLTGIAKMKINELHKLIYNLYEKYEIEYINDTLIRQINELRELKKNKLQQKQMEKKRNKMNEIERGKIPQDTHKYFIYTIINPTHYEEEDEEDLYINFNYTRDFNYKTFKINEYSYKYVFNNEKDLTTAIDTTLYISELKDTEKYLFTYNNTIISDKINLQLNKLYDKNYIINVFNEYKLNQLTEMKTLLNNAKIGI